MFCFIFVNEIKVPKGFLKCSNIIPIADHNEHNFVNVPTFLKPLTLMDTHWTSTTIRRIVHVLHLHIRLNVCLTTNTRSPLVIWMFVWGTIQCRLNFPPNLAIASVISLSSIPTFSKSMWHLRYNVQRSRTLIDNNNLWLIITWHAIPLFTIIYILIFTEFKFVLIQLHHQLSSQHHLHQFHLRCQS